MEQVTVWYLTDNEHGAKLVDTIKSLGLHLQLVNGYDLRDANILEEAINILIFDITSTNPEKVLRGITYDTRLHNCVKFFILGRKQIKLIQEASFNVLHLEFVARPVYKREFLLLLEKTIIVERYREIMKYISKEAETRIETYEGLMDITRKNIFHSEDEKKAFERILDYEKNLIKEQARLNDAIKDFTLLRQAEMFDLKDRIRAEEMLGDLRRKELMEANRVIGAQESVINYSARELDDAKRIIDAAEQVQELSRSEAIEIREELKRERELSRTLSMEVENLLKEIDTLKSRRQS